MNYPREMYKKFYLAEAYGANPERIRAWIVRELGEPAAVTAAQMILDEYACLFSEAMMIPIQLPIIDGLPMCACEPVAIGGTAAGECRTCGRGFRFRALRWERDPTLDAALPPPVTAVPPMMDRKASTPNAEHNYALGYVAPPGRVDDVPDWWVRQNSQWMDAAKATRIWRYFQEKPHRRSYKALTPAGWKDIARPQCLDPDSWGPK